MTPTTTIATQAAEPWRRFVGGLIDFGSIWAASFVISMLFVGLPGLNAILGTLLIIGYPVVAHSHWGRTLGKLATETYVIDGQGRFPSLGRSFVRTLVQLLLPLVAVALVILFFIAMASGVDDDAGLALLLLMVLAVAATYALAYVAQFLFILAHPQRRSIHDLAAGTWVVRRATVPAPAPVAPADAAFGGSPGGYPR